MFITRQYIKEHPTINFIYGDTYHHDANGGQAKECRGEPNTYGVFIKISKCANDETTFFQDRYFNLHKEVIDKSIDVIKEPLLKSDHKIMVFPKLGLGWNKMDVKAPRLRFYLLGELDRLFGHLIINIEDLI